MFERGSESAGDTASSVAAAQEFLMARPEVDMLCLIQCTSPFIQPDHLEAGYKQVTLPSPTVSQ